MALSSISACLNMFGTKTKVIWIDSYTKINSNINSSDNLNKMPLSFLTKLNDSNNYEWIKNKLKFENLCLIGIREFEPDEINIIKTFNIKTININQFNTNIIQVLKDLILWAGVAPIHISLNINSLDSKFIQCINLDSDEKTSGKIEIEPLIKFINTFCKFTNVLNVDIAELNLNNPDCGCVNKCEKTKSFDFEYITTEAVSSYTHYFKYKNKLWDEKAMQQFNALYQSYPYYDFKINFYIIAEPDINNVEKK